MTRKDYVKFAEVFRVARNNVTHPKQDDAINALLDDFCTVLQADNSHFDQEKFEAACTPK